MLSFTEPIVPVTLSLDSHTGITLFAPPWQDADGEDWQGFLGDGSKIVLLGSTAELHDWIAANPEHDLADHPAWPSFAKLGSEALTPADTSHFDFDAAYVYAAADPDDENVAALADVIEMASKIADCCEDGGLRALLNNTAEYRIITDEDPDYTSKAGTENWTRLGDTIADSWPRALTRLHTWLSWQGSSLQTDDSDPDSVD